MKQISINLLTRSALGHQLCEKTEEEQTNGPRVLLYERAESLREYRV